MVMDYLKLIVRMYEYNGKLEKIRDAGFKNFLKTDVLNIVWARIFACSTPVAVQTHVPWSIPIKIVHRLIQEFRRRNIQFWI